MFVSYSLNVSIVGLFTLRQKRIRGGSTFTEGNGGPMNQHLLLARTPHVVSVSRMARRFSIQCSLPNTHTHTVYIELDGGRQGGRRGRMGGREQWEGGGRRVQGEGVRKR